MTPTHPQHTDRSLTRGVVVTGLVLLAAGGMLALNFAAPSNTARWEKTFTAVDELRIAGDARVSVETWDRDDVAVALDADWYGHRSAPRATMDGGTLVARACDGSFWHNFYWHAYCNAQFVIRVPKGMSLTARGDSGRADVTGTFAALDVRTDSGRIEATDVTTRNLHLRTDSGSVTFSGSSPAADIRTDSGSIRVDGDVADLSARADSGSVTADLRGTPARVAVKTDSGSVRVSVPLTGYRITTSTDSGRQSVDPRLNNGTAKRSIDVSTDSGSITLQGTDTP